VTGLHRAPTGAAGGTA